MISMDDMNEASLIAGIGDEAEKFFAITWE